MVIRQLHNDALSVPADGALIVMSRIHKTLSFGEPKRRQCVIERCKFATVTGRLKLSLWGLADALADYLEAAVFRDYRLFNRRREVSFRKTLCRITGHREVVF